MRRSRLLGGPFRVCAPDRARVVGVAVQVDAIASRQLDGPKPPLTCFFSSFRTELLDVSPDAKEVEQNRFIANQ